MLLVIDIGNSHIVLGVYEGDTLREHFRVETAKGRTADEYRVVLFGLLSMAGVSPDAIEGGIMASVVPTLNDVFLRAVEQAFDVALMVVGPGLKTGMPIMYEDPREVGADRIVNAVAAFDEGGGPVIVVDFGTATTFDCISAKGEYLGGAIVPGITISANALFDRAAKLPRAEISRPPRAVGRNTIHSMQSGILFGYAALVDGLVARLESEMDDECRVVATGGLAALMREESEAIDEVDELLTLRGLRMLYLRNHER